MTKINRELKARNKIKTIKNIKNIFNIGEIVIHEGKDHKVLAIFSTFNIGDVELAKEEIAYSLCELKKMSNMPVVIGSSIFKTKEEFNKFDKVRKDIAKKEKEAKEKAEFLKLKLKYDK